MEPVDAEKLGLHDYHKIIKEPIDLKTIRTKMDTGVYKEPADFAHDIRLMLNNCFLYNPVGDPVHIFGMKFKEVFEKRWAELEDPDSRPSSTAPQSAPAPVPVAAPKTIKASTSKKEKEIKKEPNVEVGGMAKSEDIMQINNALCMIREREEKLHAELAAIAGMKEKLMQVKNKREHNPNEPFPEKLITETKTLCTTGIGEVAAPSSSSKNGRTKKTSSSSKMYGYEFDSDDEENKPALSYDEKRRLSQLVNQLPPNQLSTVISIIQRRECSAVCLFFNRKHKR
ncbi:hypothetical protein CAEBREN_29751 [Caenorhabditis brenneri]|uniref:Bromo domain-containing protein n=1 Tax=Caenorhabditis brenneri TaxID=135651 RepID=G0P972_CAEBE|nr:hypothetical protein CAEBREN_29751 [Caenorhabditis brenneri]